LGQGIKAEVERSRFEISVGMVDGWRAFGYFPPLIFKSFPVHSFNSDNLVFLHLFFSSGAIFEA